MSNIIQLKRSTTPAASPTTGDLTLGEVAINTYDGEVFFKKDNGTATIIKFVNFQHIATDSTFTANSDSLVPSQKAVKTALDDKQDTLISGTNIKSINGESILGSGDLLLSNIPYKSNVVSSGSFSGNPKKASITFTTPFADANYSVSIIGVNSRAWSVESITAAGFTINANANAALTGNVYYTAIKHFSDTSGVIAGGSFSGNPKKYTLTFSTPLIDANYSVSIIGENSRAWSIESVSANSFIINSNANTALSGNVYWAIKKHGES